MREIIRRADEKEPAEAMKMKWQEDEVLPAREGANGLHPRFCNLDI